MEVTSGLIILALFGLGLIGLDYLVEPQNDISPIGAVGIIIVGIIAMIFVAKAIISRGSGD